MIRRKLFSGNIVAKNITGTLALKMVSLLITFRMMPLYISYFDNQIVLGLWYTLLSVFTWILMFDMGIGNGLRNKLSVALANNEKELQKKIISSAYIILGGLILIFIVIGFIIIKFADWNIILNISTNFVSSDILRKSILIVFIGVLIQFWLNLISSILLALQKNILVNSFNIISNLIVLIFLRFGKTSNVETNLILLSLVYVLATCVPLLCATFYVFSIFFKSASLRIKNFDKMCAKEVLSLGSYFFAIQLGLLVINSTNPILITRIFGSADVVKYQIYYKVFSVAIIVFTVFTQPIWSATTDAWARNDIRRIEKLWCFLFIIALLGCSSTFLIIPLLQPILNIWLGKNAIEVSISVAIIFAVYCSCEILTLTATCIANGISQLRCQFICTIIAALLKIPLTYILSGILGNWGAIVIAHSIVLLPTIIMQPIALKKNLK